MIKEFKYRPINNYFFVGVSRLILSFIILAFISCSKEKNIQENDNVNLGDTITTKSGLKYFYLKKGNGPKVKMGSQIISYTDLYTKNPDTLLWTTSNDKDSIFKFILEENTMIKGFRELNKYLAEGDEVVAVIPDSLAYGDKSFIYNPYIVKDVSEPKINIADTIVQIISTNTVTDAIGFYEGIINDKENNKYHTDIDVIRFNLLKQLKADRLFTQTIELADYFDNKTENPYALNGLRSSKVSALLELGKIEEAKNYVQHYIKYDSVFWQNKLEELNE